MNKTIAITGASAGIGAATAIACGRAGMRVALGARRVDRLHEVAKQVEAAGGQAIVSPCDVRRDADVEGLMHATVDAFGQLDAVFANAGYGMFASTADQPDAQARDIFETNFWGTVRCVRAAVPIMRQQGRGHLLICTSSMSEIGIPMYGFYAATKAAQDNLGCALRAELHNSGILVSTVHPIGTSTEFFDVVNRQSHAHAGAQHRNAPAPLVHTPQRVADAVVRCLAKPRAEVWPSFWVRIGLAISTACPALSAWAMRDLMRRRYAAAAEPVSKPAPDAMGAMLESVSSGQASDAPRRKG